MTSARHQLMDLVDTGALYEQPPDELDALRLAAAQESFERHRGDVPVLDQRARDAGVDKITSLADLVPLLFSHTTYKSYPMSFITKGRWDMLLRWYDALAGVPVRDVDLS